MKELRYDWLCMITWKKPAFLAGVLTGNWHAWWIIKETIYESFFVDMEPLRIGWPVFCFKNADMHNLSSMMEEAMLCLLWSLTAHLAMKPPGSWFSWWKAKTWQIYKEKITLSRCKFPKRGVIILLSLTKNWLWFSTDTQVAHANALRRPLYYFTFKLKPVNNLSHHEDLIRTFAVRNRLSANFV